MKGVSPFVSTAFVVLFGIILISAVMFSLGKIQNQGIERSVGDQLTTTTREMATEVLDVYSSVKDYQKSLDNNTVSLVKQTEVTLPQTVGSRNYQMYVEEPQDVLLAVVEFFIDGTPVNTTSTRPTARLVSSSQGITVENKLYNIDIGLQGSTKGGSTKIRGYKYNYNGTTRDKIIIGEDTILVSVQSFNVTSDASCPNNKRVKVNGFNMYTSGGIPSSINMRATIIETNEQNTTSSSNPFTLLLCTSVADQAEATISIEVSDANGNRGSIKKKFLG